MNAPGSAVHSLDSVPVTSSDEKALPLVRAKVKELLTNSAAFRTLPADKRRAMAQDMVKVANYIVDADGLTTDTALSAMITPGTPLGGALGNSNVGTPITAIPFADEEPPKPDTAGQDFADQGGAVAAEAGGQALTDIIGKADFPGFVGGLIDGVF